MTEEEDFEREEVPIHQQHGEDVPETAVTGTEDSNLLDEDRWSGKT